MTKETIKRIRKFTEDRDWDQFHSPSDLQHVKEELADVMVYCQKLLDKLGLDADEIINMKMTQNEAKYPVDKAKGKSDKYDQL